MVVDRQYTQPVDPDDSRRSWEFRCDTVAEIKEWSKAMTEINYFSAAFASRDSISRRDDDNSSTAEDMPMLDGY